MGADDESNIYVANGEGMLLWQPNFGKFKN